MLCLYIIIEKRKMVIIMNKNIKTALIYFYFLTIFFVIIGCPNNRGDNKENDIKYGISHPPFGNPDEQAFTKEVADDLGINLIRIDYNWDWIEVGPEGSTTYDWSVLDSRLQFLSDNNLNYLLTINTHGPDWAVSNAALGNHLFTNLIAWKNFCDALFIRYSNQIKKIQFGNEWTSTYWFPGTPEQFVEIFNIFSTSAKTYSPDSSVVLGAFTFEAVQIVACEMERIETFRNFNGVVQTASDIRTWLTTDSDGIQFKYRIEYVLLNANDYDLLDIHLYDDVENWNNSFSGYYQKMSTLIPEKIETTPIIVSEFGGPNPNYESEHEEDTYHADRLTLYLEAINKMDIKEAYYFKLILSAPGSTFHWSSALIKNPLVFIDDYKREGYFVFQSFINSL